MSQLIVPRTFTQTGTEKVAGRKIGIVEPANGPDSRMRRIVGNPKSSLPCVLVFETGGTVCQKPNKQGQLEPSNTCVTPLVAGIEDVATLFVETLPTLIDSTKMKTEQRAMIAQTIYNYEMFPPVVDINGTKVQLNFVGYVVPHGTDTMTDSAIYITYALTNFGKPIVFTGSQITIFRPDTDGKKNLYRAVQVATLNVGEVVIAFGDNLIRGSRAVKFDEEAANAFLSPRRAALGNLGIFAQLNPYVVPRQEIFMPTLFSDFAEGFELITPPSGERTNQFRHLLMDNDKIGGVAVGYGAGNIDGDLYGDDIRALQDAHKPLIVVTQSSQGRADMTVYGAGAAAIDNRIIPGRDMTAASAMQKLKYAVGLAMNQGIEKPDLIEFVRRVIGTVFNDDISLPRDAGAYRARE
ncbi:MAG TPA: asparaginase domain-containing protein [Candidatus Micrarchaeota archaeon]|nr:asparaginase domain-containing protein [Candidatus Micrarchaeota archaeon]